MNQTASPSWCLSFSHRGKTDALHIRNMGGDGVFLAMRRGYPNPLHHQVLVMRRIVLLALMLTSCGSSDDIERNAKIDSLCIDGVQYLAFRNTYGDIYTAHLKPDGKPYTCEEEGNEHGTTTTQTNSA